MKYHMRSEQVVFMYHSVSSPSVPGVIGSFPVEMERFKGQIALACELGYQFRRVGDMEADRFREGRYAYITSDDGTSDWSKNVLPWAEEEKIPTHTALISGVWYEKPIYPLTHLVQAILNVRDVRKLEKLSSHIKDSILTGKQIEYIYNKYGYESVEYRRILKGTFNLILEEEESLDLIGPLSSEESATMSSRFERPDYYKQFKFCDVGVHTVRHKALDKQTDRYVSQEIDACAQDIAAVGLSYSQYYTSPMQPKPDAFVSDLEAPLRNLGYKGVFDQQGVWDQSSFIVKRIDAKNVEAYLYEKGRA